MIKTVATRMKKRLRLETDGLDSIAFHLPTFETKQTLFRRCVIPLHEEYTHGMRKERRKSRNDQIACLDKGHHYVLTIAKKGIIHRCECRRTGPDR